MQGKGIIAAIVLLFASVAALVYFSRTTKKDLGYDPDQLAAARKASIESRKKKAQQKATEDENESELHLEGEQE